MLTNSCTGRGRKVSQFYWHDPGRAGDDLVKFQKDHKWKK